MFDLPNREAMSLIQRGLGLIEGSIVQPAEQAMPRTDSAPTAQSMPTAETVPTEQAPSSTSTQPYDPARSAQATS